VYQKRFLISITLFSGQVTADKFRAKTWVYIEGGNDSLKKKRLAKKIYLLPKYIGEKEKHLYPFMRGKESQSNLETD
jgi:hypothetical protein